jgi:RNA polymerase sigma-B factor
VIDPDEARELFLRRDADPAARRRLIIGYRPIAASLARRFTGRGEALEDLVQIADIGLIKAIDRFDPQLGHSFRAFATASIVGELKHHLRDRGWSLHVPRSLQEAALLVTRERSRLSVRLGRAPTVAEIAEAAALSTEAVVDALQAGLAYQSSSLDAPLGPEPGAPTLGERLGAEDEAALLAERLSVIAPAVGALPDRQRRILFLRFYRDLTQTEIARELGISQMHVSRLLARALETIREQVADPP